MFQGSFPPATNFGTWIENIELGDITDNSLIDFSASGVTEITVMLRDPYTKDVELTLTRTGGEVTTPSNGIIQWRAEVEQMTVLRPITYDILMIIESNDDTVPMILGSVSILE